MKIRVACAQFKADLMDKGSNINHMERWVKEIKQAEPNVDFIVFPELSLTGYECENAYAELAESFPDGESIVRMCEIALQNNVCLVFGFVEKKQEQQGQVLYNSAALIDRNGRPVGCYRKVHLVEGIETKYFCRGSEYPVFDTSIGKIGIMICWDSAFPEVARSLALQGAELIAVPAAWEEPNGGDWDLVQCARSFDNVCYVAACNRVGRDRDLTFFGKSKIVGPIGRVIKELEGEAGFVCSEIDLDVISELRNGYYDLLTNRQPKTYGTLQREFPVK